VRGVDVLVDQVVREDASYVLFVYIVSEEVVKCGWHFCWCLRVIML